MIQHLDEPIDVITAFVRGKITIIRFRWKGTALAVDRTTGRWIQRHGPYPIYHFSVLANRDDLYELSFDARTLLWRIKTVQVE